MYISKIFCSDNKNKNGKMITVDAKLVIRFFVLELPLASTEQSITKVLIDDIPSLKRDAAQLEAYMTSLMKLPCSVKQYGKLFVATFERAIGEFILRLLLLYNV